MVLGTQNERGTVAKVQVGFQLTGLLMMMD